jgi:hypothetical protein
MRRLALAAALAAALAGCGKSDCQELGERICQCQPGLDRSACQTQVENQLKSSDPGEGTCRTLLESCNAPAGLDLCEWMLTADGRVACGLTTP